MTGRGGRTEMLGRGRSALALAAVAAAACGVTAAGTTPASAAAKQAPALATGTSKLAGGSTWRLEGRQLAVRLGRPLTGVRRGGNLVIEARCGEELTGDPRTWLFADSSARQVRIVAAARTIRVRLPHDVTARVNRCTIATDGTPLRPAVQVHAEMRLRRGVSPRCTPADHERVVFRTRRLLVTKSTFQPDEMAGADVLRACLLGGGTLRPLDVLGSGGGGGGGSSAAVGFAARGTRLAWAETRHPNSPTADGTLTVHTVDLAARGAAARRLAFAAGSSAPAYPMLGWLGVGAGGAIVWVAEEGRAQPSPDRFRDPVLQVGRPDGSVAVLDAAPGGTIADVAISADGRTVTWTRDGVARSAEVP